MKRSHVITVAALVAIVSLAAAVQARLSLLPARKGQIQSITVEPSTPTISTPVSLCVSIADGLQLERVNVNRMDHRFVVYMYWTDPATGATADSLGQWTQSVGTLGSGFYAVLVQSYYNGKLVDFRSMMFRVR